MRTIQVSDFHSADHPESRPFGNGLHGTCRLTPYIPNPTGPRRKTLFMSREKLRPRKNKDEPNAPAVACASGIRLCVSVSVSVSVSVPVSVCVIFLRGSSKP